MFECYMQYRSDGCAPKAAAELVAELYGKTQAEAARELQAVLERLEERDRPPGEGEPAIRLPAGLGNFYKTERRAGVSHERARAATGHAFGYAGVDLDRQLERPRREFEQELEAWTPSDTSHSIQEARR